MTAGTSLFWHDYETWGTDARRDRPVQFAGIRTNLELKVIDQPINLFCRPAADVLPHPESVFITGITPQQAERNGVCEADFFQTINTQLSQPRTCGVGYNSLRFDDEVTRFGFYRNFIDPYAREWQYGNSRWDIIDLVRMAYALRPEGIQWPQRDEGIPSFKLEDLARANAIEHVNAHDALADVYATLNLARLIRKHQPKLYTYYFGLRKKEAARRMLDLNKHTAVLHVSGMYPAKRGGLAVVIPLCTHPKNANEIIVFDLEQDPTQLLTSTPAELRDSLYTPRDKMSPEDQRVALKGVHINRSPALAPISTLSKEICNRWDINFDRIEEHRKKILAHSDLYKRLHVLYSEHQDYAEQDSDEALYESFINKKDRLLCDQVLSATPEELAQSMPNFTDKRLRQLYFRYRARNWPESLSVKEKTCWRNFCHARLVKGEYGATLTLKMFHEAMHIVLGRENANRQQELLKLKKWPAQLGLE